MKPDRTHFHSFDAFRFISFLLVFLHHLPRSEYAAVNFFLHSGGLGVSFFFVLSGFLITYILLFEKTTTGSLNLKNFFLRRSLRIWPLFYAMVLFAFATPYLLRALNFSFSNDGYEPNWLLSVLFLENYQMMLTRSFPNASPLGVMWSLCIEEHFYLLWGLAFYLLPVKRIPFALAFCVVLAPALRFIYFMLEIPSLDVFSNLDYFAFGAVPAWLLLFRKDVIVRVEKFPAWVNYLVPIVTLTLLFVLPRFPLVFRELAAPTLLGILFTAIVLFTLPGQSKIHLKDTLWISKLGKYTYGLYLFHTIVIMLVLKLIPLSGYEANWLMISVTSLAVTIVFSVASFHLFETYFVRLKRYFV